MDPKWLQSARKYLGQKEVPGPASNPWILGLWATIPWIWSTVARKDDTLLPWCGAFVRLCLTEAGIEPPKSWFRASAYADFGTKLGYPTLGAIGVIKTGKRWHVGFIVGRDNAGRIIMLGGNQNDSVKLAAFERASFAAFQWPDYQLDKIPSAGSLPVLTAALSTSEA